MSTQPIKFKKGLVETVVIDFANQGFLGGGVSVFLVLIEKVSGNHDFREGFKNVSKNII